MCRTKHTALRKKFDKVNDDSCMTKALGKVFMRRPQLETNYLKTKAHIDLEQCENRIIFVL